MNDEINYDNKSATAPPNLVVAVDTPAVEESAPALVPPLGWADLTDGQKLDAIATRMDTMEQNILWLCQTVNAITQMASQISPGQVMKMMLKGGN